MQDLSLTPMQASVTTYGTFERFLQVGSQDFTTRPRIRVGPRLSLCRLPSEGVTKSRLPTTIHIAKAQDAIEEQQFVLSR